MINYCLEGKESYEDFYRRVKEKEGLCLVVVGSRVSNLDVNSDKNRALLDQIVEQYNITTILTGGCAGSGDNLGASYAKENHIELKEFKPFWSSANSGYIRSEALGECGDLLIAFRQNKSRGVTNTINAFRKRQKFLMIFESKGKK